MQDVLVATVALVAVLQAPLLAQVVVAAVLVPQEHASILLQGFTTVWDAQGVQVAQVVAELLVYHAKVA